MPKITQFTADEKAAVLNLPNRQFPYNSFEGARFAGQQLSQLGDTTVGVGAEMAHENALVAIRRQGVLEKLQKEQDTNDFVKYTAQIEAGVKDVGNNLNQVLDPRQRPQAYFVGSKNIMDTILQQAQQANVSPNALKAIQAHAINKGEINNVRVRHASEVQWGQNQLVELNNNLETLSNEAALNPQDRVEYEKLGTAMIARSVHFTDEKHRGETAAGFLSSIQEKQMKFMMQNGAVDELGKMERGGDFSLVPPEKRAMYLREANNVQHAAQVRVQQQITDMKQEATHNAYATADHDKLTLEELDANPLISPEHKHAIAKIMEDPTFTTGSRKSNRLVIDNLAARWATETNQTPELAKKYLSELNKLRETIGSDLNKKDMERLTTIGEMLHSNARAERGVQAAEATRNVTGAINDFKSQVDAHKPGESSFNVKYKNLITKSEAEIRARVGAGEDRNKVVQDIIKRFENRNKAKPADTIDQLNKKDYMR